MMNKISLGLSISSFVLILIMFVFGNINLEFDTKFNVNETEDNLLNLCEDSSTLNTEARNFIKYHVEIWEKSPYRKVFTCTQSFFILYAVGNAIKDHNDFGKGKKHHSHSYDMYGNRLKDY